MSPHSLLPLVAFVLNVSLAALALLRNPGSRLNRVFAYFASSMALWNFGSFVLRNSPDEWTAYFAEILIHAGIIAVPAFYYHFVLIFLDSTTRHRPSLVLAYLIAFVYELINLSGTPLFMTGVKMTYWGWAPATGPLYLPYFLFFNFFMFFGVSLLLKSRRGTMIRRRHKHRHDWEVVDKTLVEGMLLEDAVRTNAYAAASAVGLTSGRQLIRHMKRRLLAVVFP